jgi:hypothetical protein
VLYLLGIAVNDFRFLASGYEVQLDWDDAWYSTFPQRALKRQYDSPMTGLAFAVRQYALQILQLFLSL